MPVQLCFFLKQICLPAFILLTAISSSSVAADRDSLQAIDNMIRNTLAETGVPAASIAIALNGQVVYKKSFGIARQHPDGSFVPATPDMRFKIASNSKHIIAAAIMLLAEQGKLSLEDTVDRFYPQLTEAEHINLRHLLTHTAGYQDYYAVGYLPPYMLTPTDALSILNQWARKPLDFKPGTRWQYSNTNYVLLGKIIESVSGQPLQAFLEQHLFAKAGLSDVLDVSTNDWPDNEPAGHTRYALGAFHEARTEAKGWLSAAGGLAMTADNLARWDMALMQGQILDTNSMRTLTTEALLKDGTGTQYALGLRVSRLSNGHRKWAHSGSVAGFRSMNAIYPDDKAAIVVLTNGAGEAHRVLLAQIQSFLLEQSFDTHYHIRLAQARALFENLQRGIVPRSWFTDNLNTWFDKQVVQDYRSSLAPLGELMSIQQLALNFRGGMEHRTYRIKTADKSLRMEVFVQPNDRFEQCLVLSDSVPE